MTGRKVYEHPLANTTLGEVLAHLRDERLLSLAVSACAAPVLDEVVIDDLGLDDGPQASATSSSDASSVGRLRGEGKRAALRQHPIVDIQCPVDSSTAVPMLVATQAKWQGAASFEATPLNFKALFDWFRLETPAREQRDNAEQNGAPVLVYSETRRKEGQRRAAAASRPARANFQSEWAPVLPERQAVFLRQGTRR